MTEIILSFPQDGGITVSALGIQGPGGGGGGVTDGDKGDITVSGSGAVFTINPEAVEDDMIASVDWTKIDNVPPLFDGTWGSLTGKPSTFPPSAHTHPAGDVTGLAAVATSGSAGDLSTGTLPAARFDDTAHGTRAGGALHATATTGAAGFMAAADKVKVNAAVISDPSGITGADAITNIVSLTQAEFDAIGSPSATTLYVITDA